MPSAPPVILIADDHSMVRTGLTMSLELDLGYRQLLEADSCASLLQALRGHRPTHLICDMVFRDGNALEVLPSIVRLYPELQILIYSMMQESMYLPALSRYGIRNFLSKDAPHEDTIASLRLFVAETGSHAAPIHATVAAPHSNPFSRLSPREHEVLHYLLQGYPVTRISTALNLHKNTVSTLKNRILEKTGLGNMKELFEAAHIYQLHI